ncbi:phage holin family protein [Paenibacillus sp. KQZ6P-2]|uniref:Phage holin family protein n=1 Tax=Paenibacillus mangrovi TaxID=2931978 RepID=A0A9X1WNT9_9BACL|nr:phage holin family protein [Paenibacillus mangrovi]
MFDKISNANIASFGVITTYVFSGWNEALALLAILVVMDWLTGVGASLREGIRYRDCYSL